MGLLKGKTVLVMGVANKRSIAWGIARSCYREGAKLVFTYQGERQRDNIRELAEENMPGENFQLFGCDVSSDSDLSAAFAEIRAEIGTLHGVAHCIAFAKTEELQGEFVNTSRDGYHLAQDVSAYSLVAVARHVRPMMTDGGSLLAMTYIGGERVVENYNVMGIAKAALEHSVRYLANDLGKLNIRVNAVSAGPIRTLSAKAVHDFSKAVHQIEEHAPLRRSTTPEEVGDVAAFLFSDLSRGVTGETIHVDEGYHILGV